MHMTLIAVLPVSLESRGGWGTQKRSHQKNHFLSHLLIQCLITEGNLDYPFKGKSLL